MTAISKVKKYTHIIWQQLIAWAHLNFIFWNELYITRDNLIRNSHWVVLRVSRERDLKSFLLSNSDSSKLILILKVIDRRLINNWKRIALWNQIDTIRVRNHKTKVLNIQIYSGRDSQLSWCIIIRTYFWKTLGNYS